MTVHRPSSATSNPGPPDKKIITRWLAWSAAATLAGLWRGAAGAALVIGAALLYQQFRQRGGVARLRSAPQRISIVALYAALGALARSTGRVSEADIATAARGFDSMRLDTQTRNAAIRAHQQGRAGGAALDALLAPFNRIGRGTPGVYRPWLEQLVALRHQARRNARWAPDELAALRHIAAAAGAPAHLLNAVLAGGDDQLEAACTILGVAPGADAAAIKQAYRQLMARHHPDRLAGAGGEALAAAEQRTREIRAAYDRLREIKGF